MSQECCQPGPKTEVQQKAIDTHNKGTKSSFKVKGMDCSDEVSAIQRAFDFEGIFGVEANIMTETVTISHQDTVTQEKLRQTIEKAGVKVVISEEGSFFEINLTRIILVSASGLILGIGLVLDWFKLASFSIQTTLYLLSIVLAGIIIFPKALRALQKQSLDMNVLMTVAVVGAIVIKEFSEAASVVFLFALAELLEAMSVARARRAIKDILSVSSKEATVVEGSKLRDVPIESLKMGDIVLVRPGENIPIDGAVSEGRSNVNQASLTGESKPVSKDVGDSVWAGTTNESGVLKIKAEKEYKDTKIAKVISLVEEAQSEKAPSQRFVDKFASIYTPSILVLAVLVAIVPPLLFQANWEDWFYKALVFLVIGCPCALVIATPVSVVSGLTSLARRGVLVKGGVHLESLGKLQAIALDKTGTITEGTPRVSEVKSFSKLSENEILRITASLESMSTHPLAKAVLHYTSSKNIEYPHPSDYRIVPGKGAEGLIDGHWYFVGNHVMAHEFGICTPEIEAYLDTVESKAMSVIVLGHRPHEGCVGEIFAIFAVGDKIRENIPLSIGRFHKAGVKMVAMLSGDNQKTVNAVAKQVGIDYAKGALLPDQKVQEIKGLVSKYHFVGMVGDGVNDAPALAHASVGIAMGVAGSDTAIETADVALMKDDILELPKAILHGKKVLNVIRFNIAFAIAIKAVFFVLAIFGLTNLWLAVAADMGASLLVTFNALRLLRIDDSMLAKVGANE
ncbi:MAG: heavy metal translocating P-type ATPase [Bacteriovoracaceae bacterium]